MMEEGDHVVADRKGPECGPVNVALAPVNRVKLRTALGPLTRRGKMLFI